MGSDSGDDNLAEQQQEDEDEYYDMVAKVSKDKKLGKEAKMAAIKQAKAAGGLVRVVEGEVDEDGKRAIGYVIEKKKGLASTRAVYKGGEERGGYGGEKTGIKTGIV